MAKSDIKVDLRDLKDFCKRLEESNAKEFLGKLVKNIGMRHLRSIVMNSPVDTGNLRNSWNVAVNEIGEGYEVSVSTNIEYAPYVNNGHRIVKNGKQVGFYEGQFFIEKSELETESKIEKIIENKINEWFNGVLNGK